MLGENVSSFQDCSTGCAISIPGCVIMEKKVSRGKYVEDNNMFKPSCFLKKHESMAYVDFDLC